MNNHKYQYQYSIIIPHYNTPILLNRLLSSIPKRKDLEIIVVDDCSSKQYQNPLKDLKAVYYWVTFLSTDQNGGGGKARNLGIEKSKGKYIIFADADDFFTEGFTEILSTYTCENIADIIFFNGTSTDSNTGIKTNRADHLNYFIKLSKLNRKKGELYLKYLFGEPWCRIVKKEFINKYKLKFEELPIHNDTLFAYLSSFYAHYINIDDRIGYCVTDREESVSKIFSIPKLIIREEVFAKKNMFLKANGINVIDPIVFNPFTNAIRRRNLSLLIKLIKIAHRYGYSILSLITDYRSVKNCPVFR